MKWLFLTVALMGTPCMAAQRAHVPAPRAALPSTFIGQWIDSHDGLEVCKQHYTVAVTQEGWELSDDGGCKFTSIRLTRLPTKDTAIIGMSCDTPGMPDTQTDLWRVVSFKGATLLIKSSLKIGVIRDEDGKVLNDHVDPTIDVWQKCE